MLDHADVHLPACGEHTGEPTFSLCDIQLWRKSFSLAYTFQIQTYSVFHKRQVYLQ